MKTLTGIRIYLIFFINLFLKGKNYNEKYNDITWNKSKSKFEKWCNGEYGYPVVDVGMREMNET